LTWRRATQTPGIGIALSVAATCAVVWSVLPALLLSAPHADNVEQLNWAHGLQWGYFKHPPLPTWLLRAAIDVFGSSAALTYALAMACSALALFLVWLCARQMMGPRRALIALLLSTGNYYLMGRGSFLNHNTVMLPFVALSAWAVLRIVRGAGWPVWLLLGLAQALGLLTKYQMALIILANAAALLSAGVHRQPRFAAHLALAGAATVLPLVPHAIWLADHRFSTFEYAGHSLLAGLGPVQRLVACATFLAQQLARLAPALFALALTRVFAWRSASALRASAGKPGIGPSDEPGLCAEACSPEAGLTAEARRAQAAALAMLALLPIAGIVLLVLVAGVAPQNHWGSSATLLIPLLWVSRWPPRLRPSLGAVAAATVLCHAGAIGWNVAVWKFDPGPHHRFAAQALAALAQRYWSTYQSGPIRLVLGPDWEAGAIALYLPQRPAVLPSGDWRQAPWVDPDLMARCGALVIGRVELPLEQQLPASQATRAVDPTVLKAQDRLGRSSAVRVALIAPSPGTGCP
jgi:4-amino-4-deoxy-L-arabinose transferase-like glycosyltransferase